MSSEPRYAPCTLFLPEQPAPTEPGWYWAIPGDGEQIVPARVVNIYTLTGQRLVAQDSGSHYDLSWFRWFGPLPQVEEASGR